MLLSQKRRQKFFNRVRKLAALADLAAKNQTLPTKPGIRAHRKKDIAYFFDNIVPRYDILDHMEKKKKLLL